MLSLARFFALGSGNAAAQGRHPVYLPALSDLRGLAPISNVMITANFTTRKRNDHPPVDAGLGYTRTAPRNCSKKCSRISLVKRRTPSPKASSSSLLGTSTKRIHEVNECIRAAATRN